MSVGGTLTRSGPKGTVTVTFSSVIVKLDCDHGPFDGEFTVRGGGREFGFSFMRSCGCGVDMERPDRMMLQMDLCRQPVDAGD